MPFLRFTKGEFDHKFVGSLCILDYDLQLEQINCSFLMGSTRGQHFFASQMFLEHQETNSLCLCWRLLEDRIASTGQVIGPPVLQGADLIQ